LHLSCNSDAGSAFFINFVSSKLHRDNPSKLS
jgi:hypothetical protein